MSQDFEKETASSTARSLVGALVALGSGFVFMMMGMAAVTANNVKVEGDKSARALVRTLHADILASAAVQVLADKRSMRLSSGSGEILYKVGEGGDVTRVSGASSQKLVRLKEVTFEVSGRLLRMSWTGSDGPARAVWAVPRFPGVGKS